MVERDPNRRIFRYKVPVDDNTHELTLGGPILHIACRNLHEVEVWAETSTDGSVQTREYIVVGTGHPLPKDFKYVGTAIDPSGNLVWHLLASHA